MADDKIYTPEEITESPFPQEVADVIPVESDVSSKDTHSPATIKGAGFPQRVIAQETISQALNTKSKKILQEFQFTESGAMQIGKFLQAISGDIRISPEGLIARNKEGNVTIAIDGETGDVTLQGTLQSGSVITGNLIIGEGGTIQIGNDDGDTLIDEFGIVSANNFRLNSKNGTPFTTFLNSSFADRTTSVDFDVVRSTKALLTLSVGNSSEQTTPGLNCDGQVEYRLYSDIQGELLAMNFNSFLIAATNVRENITLKPYAASKTVTLQPGSHHITLQSRITSNTNLQAVLQSYDFSVVLLGN